MVDDNLIGFIAASVSVFCFGTNFIPVKKYNTGDGMFFQWCMCLGVWISGFITQLVLNARFEPLACLGGILWCTGNITAVPIIQCIGLGLGMLLWGGTALITGWACGMIGIVEKSEASSVHVAWLNYLGFALALTSMLIFSQIKTNTNPDLLVEEEEDEESLENDERLTQTSSDSYAVSLLAPPGPHTVQSTSADANASIEVSPNGKSLVATGKNLSEGSWTDALSPPMKRAVGIGGALLAGVFYGTNFIPPQYLIDHMVCADDAQRAADECNHSQYQYNYVFSHFSGILLASTIYFLIYCLYTRNRPWISSEIALPSFLSGTVWSLAQIGWFIANSKLAQVISFPIVTTGPGVVASLVGIILYKEIQGTRNFVILGCAVSVTLTGVICIALSKLL